MDVTPPSTPICTTPGEDDPAPRNDDATTPQLPTRTATTTSTTRIPTDAEVAARPVSSITPPSSPRILDPDARSVLPLPADANGLALRARILATFAAGTWETLGDLLAEARPLPLRTRLIAVWLPLTEALAGHAKLPDGAPTPATGRVHRQADGHPPIGGQPRSPVSDTLPTQPLAHRVRSSDAERELSALLRADIRLALARFEEAQPELWLVPATPVDETATYLGALVLNLRGHPTRPWIWKVPPPGLAVAISVFATDARPTTGIIGSTTLAELCRQNGL